MKIGPIFPTWSNFEIGGVQKKEPILATWSNFEIGGGLK